MLIQHQGDVRKSKRNKMKVHIDGQQPNNK